MDNCYMSILDYFRGMIEVGVNPDNNLGSDGNGQLAARCLQIPKIPSITPAHTSFEVWLQ